MLHRTVPRRTTSPRSHQNRAVEQRRGRTCEKANAEAATEPMSASSSSGSETLAQRRALPVPPTPPPSASPTAGSSAGAASFVRGSRRASERVRTAATRQREVSRPRRQGSPVRPLRGLAGAQACRATLAFAAGTRSGRLDHTGRLRQPEAARATRGEGRALPRSAADSASGADVRRPPSGLLESPPSSPRVPRERPDSLPPRRPDARALAAAYRFSRASRLPTRHRRL